MSYKILTPAWESNLPTTQKFILVSLADQANDDGVCWPSINHLCKRTGLSTRAVFDGLKKLEELGHITRKSRPGHSNVFVIHPKQNVVTCGDTPAPRAYPPLHQVHTTPAPRAPITVIEPSMFNRQ